MTGEGAQIAKSGAMASDIDGVPRASSPGTPKSAEKRVRRRSIAWAVAPLITLGIATPFVIWHAAKKLRSRTLKMAALGWAAAVIVSFGMASSNGRAGVVSAVGTTVLISVMVGGTFHAFALRTAVFGLDSLDVDRTARRTSLRIAKEHPLEAVRLQIGRIDVSDDMRMRDGGLIDLNNASAGAIGQALGLNATGLADFEKQRDVDGSFSSPADFELRTNCDPQILEPLEGRLICLPRLGSTTALPLSRHRPFQADGRTSGAPTDSAIVGQHVSSYLWAISPLLTGGIAAAPAMAFAAVRLKSGKLWVVAGAYLAVLLTLAFTEGLTGAAAWNTIAQWVVGGVATVHALSMRKAVFEVDVVRSDIRKRQEALRIVKHDPQEAIRLEIGRVDVPEAERYPDGGLIDMNNVSLEALQATVGLDAETAQRVVDTRSSLWGFTSVADVCNQLDLAPQRLDAVSNRLIFLPMLGSSRVEDVKLRTGLDIVA